PSAQGVMNGGRYGNHYALERWAGSLEAGTPCEAEREPERDATIALETVMLGLRLTAGLDARDYTPRAWAAIERRYGAAFAHAVATGRLERAANGVRTPRAHALVPDHLNAWIQAPGQGDRRPARDEGGRGVAGGADASA